jgi:hypothetical protein
MGDWTTGVGADCRLDCGELLLIPLSSRGRSHRSDPDADPASLRSAICFTYLRSVPRQTD